MAVVSLLVEALGLSLPTPSPHLDLRTRGSADGYSRPRAQDILGILVIRFRVVALVGDDQLHWKPDWLDLLKSPDEVRRVVRRPSPELHRHDELLPRLHRHRLLREPTRQDTPTVSSQRALPELEHASVVRARGRRAEPGRVDSQVENPHPRLLQEREEEAVQPPRLRPLRDLA